jgi:hypothetical protein
MWDSALLAHDDRSRILPDEYRRTVIRKNGDVQQTFLVDGLVAGTWRVERAKERATLELQPFAPLPRAARTELRAEAEDLVRFVEPDAGAHRVETRRPA